jgi:phage-related protein
MGKLKLAFEIAQFVLFLISSIKDLVLQAEEQMPEAGKGSEKFAAVKEAVLTAAKYADIADEAVEKADEFINDSIEGAVANFINAS